MDRASSHRAGRRAALVALGLLSCEPAAYAAPPAAHAVVMDWTAARFWAAELGGHAKPVFVTEDELLFAAELLLAHEPGEETAAAPTARGARGALDQVVAETLLTAKGHPAERDDEPLRRALMAIYLEGHGGLANILKIATPLGFTAADVTVLAMRWADAAIELNRRGGTIYSRDEEVVRLVADDAANTASASAPRDPAADALARRQLFDRANDAKATFLQQARSRITVVLTRQLQ